MSVMTVAILAHQLGLALGLGGAFCVEVLGMAMFSSPIREEQVRTIRRLSQIVLLGYLLLCLSGLTFLTTYWMLTPEKLYNPKLWAKLSIVFVLGVNGLALHRLVFDRLPQRVGRPLFADMRARERYSTLFLGSVSTVSWLTAAILGSVRELNNVVPYGMLIAIYLLVLASAFTIAVMMAASAERRARKPERALS